MLSLTQQKIRGVLFFSKFKVKKLFSAPHPRFYTLIYIYIWIFLSRVNLVIIRNFTTTKLFNPDIDFHMIYGDV